jgi:hypothetical protein
MSTTVEPGLPRSNEPVELEEVDWNVEDESSAVGQAEELGKQASTLVRQMSLVVDGEIDGLIGELKDLRTKLENRSSRIQNDIAEYAELSGSAAQLTKIVSDSVAQVERKPGFGWSAQQCEEAQLKSRARAS